MMPMAFGMTFPHGSGLVVAGASILALALLGESCVGQETANTPASSDASVNTTLPVNWVYGAYIPKDAKRKSCSPDGACNAEAIGDR
jgi:hypothetical protein